MQLPGYHIRPILYNRLHVVTVESYALFNKTQWTGQPFQVN